MAIDSLRLVVPPHPKLPPGSQHAQLPSDISHKGEEQRVNNQPPTHVDGVGHGIARSRSFASATRMEKDPPNVGVDLENQGPSHWVRKSRRESTLRTVLTVVSGYFKRPQTRNGVAVAGVHPEIDQLRREIVALEKRCADLEGANHAVCGSCRSSTLNLPQGLQQPNAEMSKCTISLVEDSECNRTTTNVAMQADLIPLETNSQAVPARQGPVQVLARAEGQVGAKDLDIQPTVVPRAVEAEPDSLLDQNWAGMAPATQVTVRADLEGLARKDQVFGVEFAQTGLQKSTRNEDEELNAKAMVEFEAQPGYIDQERLPRKKRGDEEGEEAETPLPRVYQERLPRRKEKGSKGGRSS
ncbi:hypothetical protein HD554DRAFT_2093696 [Boletus coccyginus]|nr:hypothetical protein HD554DRAFT_2093696 [Boletus coccyginus]